MSKKLFILCALMLVFMNIPVKAQCTFNGTNGGNITPVLNNVVSHTCVTPGQHIVIPVVSGRNYVFDACPNAISSLELTLFDDAGANFIGYANQGCPNGNPRLNFVAFFTGNVLLQLNNLGCGIGGACMQIDVMETLSPPAYEACQPITSICSPGTFGPFNFGSRGFKPNDCLYWSGSVAYVLLNISASGNLNVLVQGNIGLGYLDMSIYKVPAGYAPCHAIKLPNLLNCYQGQAANGCIELGTCMNACGGTPPPGPFVAASEQVLIIIENYSYIESSFMLTVGACAGSALVGPPVAMLPPPSIACRNGAHFLVEPVNMGGTWTSSCGNCVDAESGYFNPLIAGLGNHSVTYQVGTGGCNQQSSTFIQVNECCIPVSIPGLPVSIPVNGNVMQLSAGNLPAHTVSVFLELKSNYGHAGLVAEILENGVPYLDFAIPVNTHFQGRFYLIAPSQLTDIRLCEGPTSNDGGNVEYIVRDAQSGAVIHSGIWVMDGACQTFNLTPTYNLSGVAQWSSNSTGLTIATDWGVADFDPLVAGQGTWSVTFCWDDNVNCSSCITQSILVTCNQPVVTLNTVNASCQNIDDGLINVSASGGAGGYTYFLNGLGQSGTATHVFPNIACGSHSVWVVDQSGCVSDTMLAVVNANTNFFPAITTYPDTCNLSVGQITLTVSSGQPPFLYALDNGSWQASGEFFNVGAGIHQLHIVDATGCGQSEEIEVFTYNIDGCAPSLISTAFSPNGDGVNDVWIISELNANTVNFVSIFDRWGGVIRKFQNYDNDMVVWDGSGNKGQTIPEGTYFYTIEIPETNRKISGWIHLIR